MPTVFINYRREESSGEARALFNDLVTHLGEDAVFMDVDSIAPGQDFRDVVHERVATCDVMLSLVGKEWLTVTSRSGTRRLDEPGDFVRLEIEAALKRKIPVAPVLLHGADMPAPESLPDALRDFAFRNAFELSHTRWESDVEEMLRRLRLIAPPQPVARGHVSGAHAVLVPPAAPRGNGSLIIAVVAFAALAIGGYLYVDRAGALPPSSLASSAPAATEEVAAPGGAGQPAGRQSADPAATPAMAAGAPAANSLTPAGASAPRPRETPEPESDSPPPATPAPVTAALPIGVPLALGNQLVGQESCLERLGFASCAPVPTQRWRFEGAADGSVRIHNANAGAGMCVELVQQGTNLVPAFASCGLGASQRWSIAPAGAAARFFLFRNASTGADQCLGAGRRPDQTFILRMVSCGNLSAQRWRMTPQ